MFESTETIFLGGVVVGMAVYFVIEKLLSALSDWWKGDG